MVTATLAAAAGLRPGLRGSSQVSPISKRYMEVQLADKYLQDWYRAAEMESELIAESELGLTAE